MLCLLQMQKPECLDGFSSADPFPLSQLNAQPELRPIFEKNLLMKVSPCKPFAMNVLHANPPCHCIRQACYVITP